MVKQVMVSVAVFVRCRPVNLVSLVLLIMVSVAVFVRCRLVRLVSLVMLIMASVAVFVLCRPVKLVSMVKQFHHRNWRHMMNLRFEQPACSGTSC